MPRLPEWWLVPEVRSLPEHERTAVASTAMLDAMKSSAVRWAGLACSAMAALGAAINGRIWTRAVPESLVGTIGDLMLGAIVGGMLGGLVYAVTLIAKARPTMRALVAERGPRTSHPDS